MTEAQALASLFERYAIDHKPDGWPAIRQIELSNAAAELRRLDAERDELASRVREMEGLLEGVSRNFTRNDDLPDDLVPRIDAALAAQKGKP